MFTVKTNGKYKDVTFLHDNTVVGIGLLDSYERLTLAEDLLMAVNLLVGNDFTESEDYAKFVKENS